MNGSPRGAARVRKPEWLRKKIGFAGIASLKGELRAKGLHTVCESARCPNIGECFSRRTATFMILGDTCARSCAFCAVKKGKMAPPDSAEPDRVAEMARRMELRHVVITSVTRDDLTDGGAAHFAKTVLSVRENCPGAKVEVLTPDFGGDLRLVDAVLDSAPDIFNHNVETVPSLYPLIRPQADFEQSLSVLRHASECGIITKSGIMVGLGETFDEIMIVAKKLKETGLRVLTVGQYLAPSLSHASVVRFYEEEWFEMISKEIAKVGIGKVFSGPFVRSSYMAEMVGGM